MTDVGHNYSQQKQILGHLKFEPITALDALSLYGCFRLAARIHDLRAKGHDIETETVEEGGKRYARYRLIREL